MLSQKREISYRLRKVKIGTGPVQGKKSNFEYKYGNYNIAYAHYYKYLGNWIDKILGDSYSIKEEKIMWFKASMPKIACGKITFISPPTFLYGQWWNSLTFSWLPISPRLFQIHGTQVQIYLSSYYSHAHIPILAYLVSVWHLYEWHIHPGFLHPVLINDVPSNSWWH